MRAARDKLTERANRGNNTNGFPVASGFHVFGNLQDLTCDLGGDATGRLRHLQATENIPPGIWEGLTLFQGNGSSETIPIGLDQVHKPEQDLLPGHDTGCTPCGECLLGRLDSGLELLVGALGHACNKVVRGGIRQINPRRTLGRHKLIINEIGGVNGVGNSLVAGRVFGSGGSRRGGRGGELLSGGMQPASCRQRRRYRCSGIASG